jgi:hypothetical protein
MTRSAALRTSTAVAVVAAGVLALAGPASAQDPASAPSGAAGSPALGVVAQPDGWLTYTHPTASSLALGNPRTTTVAGAKDADGACHSSGSGTVGPGSPGIYQEEVGFDPSTCDERILSGTLSTGDAAKLSAAPADASSTQTPTLSGAGVAPALSGAAASTTSGVASAAATSYSSAHVKTAWIDPVNITITSLAANLKWPLYGAGGTLTGRVNPYEFKYDGWSSTGPSKITFPSLPGNAGWSMRETDSFTNNDFAAIIYALLGPAGWAACGFHLSTTAHFHHDVTVRGYRNGNRGWSWNDSKSGACSNLVHHRESDGFGWAS